MDFNRRIVYYSIETGGSYEGLAPFCSIMNMPCLSKPAYYQHVETILDVRKGQETTAEVRPSGQQERSGKRCQGEQLRRTRREEALGDAEGVTYEYGAF